MTGTALLGLTALAFLPADTPSAAPALRPVPRAEVFPLEELPANLRPRAEATLLRLLDSEALYTVIGGLKPMSSGWGSNRFDVERPELQEIEDLRQIVRTFRVGRHLTSSVLPFWRVFDGKRFTDATIFHEASVGRTVAKYQDFFGFYGVTPSSGGVQTVMAFETDATPRRNFGYGVLYGYPLHAVRFFVDAAEHQRAGKGFVERDFLSIPVFSGSTNRFVYAVPKGHIPNADDDNLRKAAEPILADYRVRRARFIGEGKPGVVAMLRDWMCDTSGCSPDIAVRKSAGRAVR